MSHLTEMQLLSHVDGEQDDAGIAQHLEQCEACTTRLDAIKRETQQLTHAMQQNTDAPLVIPAFVKPRLSLGRFAILNMLTGILVWSLQFLWKSLFEGLVFQIIS